MHYFAMYLTPGLPQTLEYRFNWELSILDPVASLLAAILYQGNHDMNHKLLNIVSTEPLVQ